MVPDVQFSDPYFSISIMDFHCSYFQISPHHLFSVGTLGHGSGPWPRCLAIALETGQEQESREQSMALLARAARAPALPFRFRIRACDFVHHFQWVDESYYVWVRVVQWIYGRRLIWTQSHWPWSLKKNLNINKNRVCKSLYKVFTYIYNINLIFYQDGWHGITSCLLFSTAPLFLVSR